MERLAKWSVCLAALAACVGDAPTPTDGGSGGPDATTSDGTTKDVAGDTPAGAPVHPPTSIAYADSNPTKGTTVGTVTIGKANDESDVTSYKLYWGVAGSGGDGGDAGAAAKLLLLADIPKTGSNVTYALSGAVPSGAIYLIAVSSNAAGEMADGPSTTPVDNYPIWTDLGASADASTSISFPYAAVDTINQKLIVVAQGPSNTVALYVCNLDGSSCSYTAVGAANGGLSPSVAVDTTNKKLLIAAHDNSTGHLLSYRCDLNGTNCGSAYDISQTAGQTFPNFYPMATLNANGDKFYVAVENYSWGRAGLYRCVNGSNGLANCAYTDVSNAISDGGAGTADKPAVAYASGKVFIAANNINNGNFKPVLFVCDETQWPSCTWADISAGDPVNATQSTLYPVMTTAFDSTNGKMLTVATDYSISGHPGLFRCDATGANCTHADLSGMPLDAGYNNGTYPHVVVDTPGGRLYVAAQDNNGGQKPVVFHCDLDGTNCARIDVSAGQGTSSAFEVTAVIDPYNKRLLVVTDDMSNGRPSLFSLGLW